MVDATLVFRSDQRSSPRLESLPQEVYDLIFRSLHSKRSVWPVLFVSRKLYHAVLPTLYRKLFFEVDSSVGPYHANYKMLQLADKENQGLLYIEEVELSPQDELKRNPHEPADYPDAIQLLAAIPRASLKLFVWDSWHQIPAGVLRLLWKRQHRLTNVELLPCDKPLDELTKELGLSGDSFCQYATELRIADVGNGKMPAVALQTLKSQSRIDTLTLEFWSIKSKIDAFYDRDDSDHGDSSEAANERLKDAYREGLLKELFGLSKQPRLANPLSLRALHLYGMNLCEGPRHIFHAIDLTVLKDLSIIRCYRTDIFLTKMSQLPAKRQPCLRQLDIYHEEDGEESTWVSDSDRTDRTVNSINEILLSMKDTLHTLWIIMRGIWGLSRLVGPMSPGIANHGGTLRSLTVDVRSYSPPPTARNFDLYVGWFPRQAWEEVCASMAQLEQLYVPFPPIVADSHLTARPEFRDYLVRKFAVQYLEVPLTDQWVCNTHQITALQIPTLRMLNMNTWPYPVGTTIPISHHISYDSIADIVLPWHSDTKAFVPEKFYWHCLEYLVRDIVEQRDKLIHHPFQHLDIVGFGLYEQHHHLGGLRDSLVPVHFVSSRVKSLGKATNWVRRVSWDEIKGSYLKGLVSQVDSIDWVAKRISKKKPRT